MKVVLQRQRGPNDDKETLGTLSIDGEFFCDTLELPSNNKDNHPDRSCILSGTYQVQKTMSPHLGFVTPELLNVPGREYIRIHPANFVRQLLGCMAVGFAYADIDQDDVMDITKSEAAFKAFMAIVPQEFEITILDAP